MNDILKEIAINVGVCAAPFVLLVVWYFASGVRNAVRARFSSAVPIWRERRARRPMAAFESTCYSAAGALFFAFLVLRIRTIVYEVAGAFSELVSVVGYVGAGVLVVWSAAFVWSAVHQWRRSNYE